MSKIDELKQIIDESKNIVFFGGAGVSTESGIPDFRSSNGVFSKALNSNIQPEQVVSHTYYKKIPKEFFEFYFNNMVFPEAKPNSQSSKLKEKLKLSSRKTSTDCTKLREVKLCMSSTAPFTEITVKSATSFTVSKTHSKNITKVAFQFATAAGL